MQRIFIFVINIYQICTKTKRREKKRREIKYLSGIIFIPTLHLVYGLNVPNVISGENQQSTKKIMKYQQIGTVQ